MICKIQVVTIGEDGRKETRELTSIQRTDVKPETLGLTLAEGKMILKDLQQIVVESQVSSLLLPKRTCPECGEPRCSKGNHTLSVRTVFGQLTVSVSSRAASGVGTNFLLPMGRLPSGSTVVMSADGVSKDSSR